MELSRLEWDVTVCGRAILAAQLYGALRAWAPLCVCVGAAWAATCAVLAYLGPQRNDTYRAVSRVAAGVVLHALASGMPARTVAQIGGYVILGRTLGESLEHAQTEWKTSTAVALAGAATAAVADLILQLTVASAVVQGR